MRYVAAFRAYDWDADIAALAERFFRNCPGARHVVLADETRGPLPIEGHEVIGHTVALESMGLARQPRGRSLWYNVDYGPYVLRQALPGYERYLLSESDVAVNLDLAPMVAHSIAQGIDFISHDIRPAEPDWMWTITGQGSTAEPWRSLLVVMLFSGRALDHLLVRRQALSQEFQAGRLAQWPFCEIFVPSTLRDGGFRIGQVAEFAETRDLRNRPKIDIADPRASRPGSLVHSVVGRAALLRYLVGGHEPLSWFDPGSWLRQRLERYRIAEYAPVIEARLAEIPDAAQALRQLRDAQAAEEAAREIAPQRVTLHAQGWTLDLGPPHALCRIEFAGAGPGALRPGHFVIEAATGEDWRIVHERPAGPQPLAPDPQTPGAVIFVPPVAAARVRLRRLDGRLPALRGIKAFGSPLIDVDASRHDRHAAAAPEGLR